MTTGTEQELDVTELRTAARPGAGVEHPLIPATKPTALRSFRGLREDSEELNRPSEVTHPHLGQFQFVSVGV